VILYDWDLQDPPLLTSANGLSVVLDGGTAGILASRTFSPQQPVIIACRPGATGGNHE